MRNILFSAAALAMAGVSVAQDQPAAAPAAQPATAPAPASSVDNVSYIIGSNIAKNFTQQGIEVNLDSLLAGMKDTIAGAPAKFTNAQMQEIMMKFQTELQAKQENQAAEAGKKNVEAGKTFLENNGKREGVTTTATGLQYEVLKPGTGAKPAATDTVKVHYHGTLLDGTVFDSSVERDEPVEFPLDQVIKGWTEGVQLMPVGSKYKFYIPSALAYGERGNQGIAPNSTLIFEVELLEIVKAQ